MASQKELKKEAEEILQRLDLMTILEKYGEPRVVGSVVLELIVKLDLDIHVLLPHGELLDITNKIANELLNTNGIREVRITDYRRTNNGIKIGIDECPATSGNWTIDIWLTKDVTATGIVKTQKLFDTLTDQHRKTILEIKQHYYSRGKLRDGISTLIYDAVLGGVSNVWEFEETQEFKEYEKDH